jgi:IS30 family transposase
MANQLKMATIDGIQTLHQRGWSNRRIARALGIHRDTVAHHLRRAKPAGAPTGSAPTPGDPHNSSRGDGGG